MRRGGGENTRKHRDLRASALHRRLGGAFEGGYRSQSCSAGCWSIKAALLLKSYQGKGEEKEERIYGTTQLGASRDCLQTAEMLPGGFPIPMICKHVKGKQAKRQRGVLGAAGESGKRLKGPRDPKSPSVVFSLTKSWRHKL